MTTMKWDEEEEDGGGGRGQEDEGDVEEEEEEGDCFFEPLDRIPSSVSFDIASSESDDDDVRISFASAIAPPSDLRHMGMSEEEEEEEEEEEDDDDDNGVQGYEYGIWMAEPISIKERRRRLLEGLGFTSSKDLASPLTMERRRRRRRRSSSSSSSPYNPSESHHNAGGGGGGGGGGGASPLPPPSPVITRSRSDTQIVSPPPNHYPLLVRSSSAPLWLWDGQPWSAHETSHRRWEEGFGGGGDRGAAGNGSATTTTTTSVPKPSLAAFCTIKNLDTGKEFVVSKLGEDGAWDSLSDLQTGMKLTMDEFERSVGYSPIVKELMRRVNVGTCQDSSTGGGGGGGGGGGKHQAFRAKSSKSSSGRKKGGWLKSIKVVANSVTGLISEKEREFSLTQRFIGRNPSRSEWMKVHQHGKSYKEFTGLYMCQEIQAHQGSIWTIKFSPDAHYMASAGEDRVIHVWQALEFDTASSSRRQEAFSTPHHSMANGLPDQPVRQKSQPSKRSRKGGKSSVPDYIVMPEAISSFSATPVCSFQGHLDDVLDLSWSKSQYLLSSSMDKTVRLWDMESKACLKLFAHNDYVTCIQFNPMDDRYFISGSLDAKVRIWSIPDRQVVDWSDLHEMVTAACYTPDGQRALVGSHKGSCRFYNTSESKLCQEAQIDIQNKKKKSNAKKITGFQFAPGNPSEVLITAADSQIRVFDGVDMIRKFRGFRNTSSQISASFTSDGKYVVCASEDSHVYIWKGQEVRNVGGAGGGKGGKGWVTTRSHEHFHCRDVSVAIPWPSCRDNNCGPPSLPSRSMRHDRHYHLRYPPESQQSTSSVVHNTLEDVFMSSSRSPKKSFSEHALSCPEELQNPSHSGTISNGSSSSFVSASSSLRRSGAVPSISSSATSSSSWYRGGSNRTGSTEAASAWGMVVVTAGLGGEIRVYQNFGLPLRLNRQTNLFFS